jgi:hypothetical protein
VEIRDYQKWLYAWDSARMWDRMLPSHTLLHAVEELGEVSRLVQMIEGYREPAPANPDEVRRLLALELSDLQVMLFKVAYLCGIDMEEAMRQGMTKADARFPNAESGHVELDGYWARFADYLRTANLSPFLAAHQSEDSPQDDQGSA